MIDRGNLFLFSAFSIICHLNIYDYPTTIVCRITFTNMYWILSIPFRPPCDHLLSQHLDRLQILAVHWQLLLDYATLLHAKVLIFRCRSNINRLQPSKNVNLMPCIDLNLEHSYQLLCLLNSLPIFYQPMQRLMFISISIIWSSLWFVCSA